MTSSMSAVQYPIICKQQNSSSKNVSCDALNNEISQKKAANRRSAVERLEESKANYVKTESVLDCKQNFQHSSNLHVSNGPKIDLLLKEHMKCIYNCQSIIQYVHAIDLSADNSNKVPSSVKNTSSKSCNAFDIKSKSHEKVENNIQQSKKFFDTNAFSNDGQVKLRSLNAEKSPLKRPSERTTCQNANVHATETAWQRTIEAPEKVSPNPWQRGLETSEKACPSTWQRVVETPEKAYPSTWQRTEDAECPNSWQREAETACPKRWQRTGDALETNFWQINPDGPEAACSNTWQRTAPHPNSVESTLTRDEPSDHSSRDSFSGEDVMEIEDKPHGSRTSDYVSRSSSFKCSLSSDRVKNLVKSFESRMDSSQQSPDRSARSKSVSRSKSDVSSRFSKGLQVASAVDDIKLERFFNTMGLDTSMWQCLTAPSRSPVHFFDSVSSVNSEDHLSSVGSEDSAREVLREGLKNSDLQKHAPTETSIVEKNARVVKWLYNCHNVFRKSTS